MVMMFLKHMHFYTVLLYKKGDHRLLKEARRVVFPEYEETATSGHAESLAMYLSVGC